MPHSHMPLHLSLFACPCEYPSSLVVRFRIAARVCLSSFRPRPRTRVSILWHRCVSLRNHCLYVEFLQASLQGASAVFFISSSLSHIHIRNPRTPYALCARIRRHHPLSPTAPATVVSRFPPPIDSPFPFTVRCSLSIIHPRFPVYSYCSYYPHITTTLARRCWLEIPRANVPRSHSIFIFSIPCPTFNRTHLRLSPDPFLWLRVHVPNRTIVINTN